MKVCKFEKIKDEDEMKQVINCIQKEHPYVAVVPILAQLQEWLQAISISWFHEFTNFHCYLVIYWLLLFSK